MLRIQIFGWAVFEDDKSNNDTFVAISGEVLGHGIERQSEERTWCRMDTEPSGREFKNFGSYSIGRNSFGRMLQLSEYDSANPTSVSRRHDWPKIYFHIQEGNKSILNYHKYK
jgi:hypothetical protein